MMLAKLYDFTEHKNRRDAEKIADKISDVASSADTAGSVVNLKLHFKEWLDMNEKILISEQRKIANE